MSSSVGEHGKWVAGRLRSASLARGGIAGGSVGDWRRSAAAALFVGFLLRGGLDMPIAVENFEVISRGTAADALAAFYGLRNEAAACRVLKVPRGAFAAAGLEMVEARYRWPDPKDPLVQQVATGEDAIAAFGREYAHRQLPYELLVFEPGQAKHGRGFLPVEG